MLAAWSCTTTQRWRPFVRTRPEHAPSMTVRCGPCPSLAAVSGPQQDRLIECQHRRAVLLNIALITALGAAPMQADAGQQVSPDLVPYASPGQYSMLVPVTWKQTSKPGADVMFQDAAASSNTLGVSILPVRIQSLEQFGSLRDVETRILAAERAKESTMSTAMLSSSVRGSPPNTTYEFEYEVDSTRGKKRLLAAVTVAGSKLHILNASVGCGKGETATCAPLEADLQRLRRAIASFDVDRGA
ncbi:hypothetical protein ACKKBG_A03730 [Auxenochlorella protothecoides x Auxenochlorella symbiontica]|uniref:PsbP C-terminal domain-containing protein n=2 Tax=Auxenochlorella protothecoides TaxID=3075 RepID=A0A1D1ZXT3_AUXPR